MTILINASMGPSQIPASAGMTFKQLDERTDKYLEVYKVQHVIPTSFISNDWSFLTLISASPVQLSLPIRRTLKRQKQ